MKVPIFSEHFHQHPDVHLRLWFTQDRPGRRQRTKFVRISTHQITSRNLKLVLRLPSAFPHPFLTRSSTNEKCHGKFFLLWQSYAYMAYRLPDIRCRRSSEGAPKELRMSSGGAPEELRRSPEGAPRELRRSSG